MMHLFWVIRLIKKHLCCLCQDSFPLLDPGRCRATRCRYYLHFKWKWQVSITQCQESITRWQVSIHSMPGFFSTSRAKRRSLDDRWWSQEEMPVIDGLGYSAAWLLAAWLIDLAWIPGSVYQLGYSVGNMSCLAGIFHCGCCTTRLG